MREAEEEIGLPPEKVDVISRLATYDTSTGFRIHPVVGWIEPPIEMTLDAFEVAEVFELPLAFILDPAITSASPIRGLKRDGATTFSPIRAGSSGERPPACW